MSDTETMQAIAIEGGTGDADALKIAHIVKPNAGDGQLLVRVHAAGVNRPDIFQRMGYYPPPPGASETLGLEIAGEVVEGHGRWKAGDRICALLPGGGYAQYAVCDARHALPIPEGLSFAQAASLPETVITVYANMFEDGGLKAGETLLIHGATSGIGVMAIQMAKAAGARVIATARSAAKAEAALSLGADLAIDTSAQDFGKVAAEAGGIDVVLDMVGGAYFAGNMEALNRKGRIVYIASLGGMEITVPVIALMQKNAIITGSTLRGRSDEEKARLIQAIEQKVWPWIKSGAVKPIIDIELPLESAAEAHRRMESGSHVGKIVLDTQ